MRRYTQQEVSYFTKTHDSWSIVIRTENYVEHLMTKSFSCYKEEYEWRQKNDHWLNILNGNQHDKYEVERLRNNSRKDKQ